MNNKENKPGSDIDSLIRQNEFGTRFRIARESARLSTAEVSDELRLSEDIIKALENSQLDSLPAPTFTQGYIRSYAKLLKLPVDEILKAYDQLIPQKDSPLTARTGVSTQTNSNDLLIKLVSIGFLIVALVLLVFWFQQAEFDFIKTEDTEKSKSEIEVESETTEPGEIVNDVIIVPEITSETENQEHLPEQQEIIDVETEISDVDAETDVEMQIEASAPELIESNEKADIQQSQQLVDDVELITAVRKTAQVVQPVIGKDILVMATATESWAEVEDANGARLFFDLMKKDKEYKIRGQAPFKLFLGNAPSVSLGVNNRLINVADYVRRNNIAHVEITANGAISPLSRRVIFPGSNPQFQDTTSTTNNSAPVLEVE